MKVAVTDYTFDSLDVERAILEPMGCEVVGPYARDEPDSLLVLVADADCVITQFAPVDARVIARWGVPARSSATASGSITSISRRPGPGASRSATSRTIASTRSPTTRSG